MSTALARVLCVDDEPMVLEGLERNLGEHFEVVTASSGRDALAVIASQQPFAAIVSDMRMPQMNGAEFLARARELSPDSSRMLLTGYAETSAAIAAVNEGHIFRFLCKPCAPDVLQRHLVDAVRQHQLISAERQLLSNTLNGAISMMSDLLALAAPTVFERARQLRARVASAAAKLGYENAWEYETAALLAHVGCVTLPPGLAEKVWAEVNVSVAERAIYDSHPLAAHRLIAAIPRLERVAEIVRRQSGPKVSGDPEIDRGVELLRAAIELDQLLGRHVPLHEASQILTERRHAAVLVTTLCAHASEVSKAGVRLIKIAEAVVGWVLDQDVRSPSGGLLIKAGSVLSPVLIEALHRHARGTGVVEPLRIRPT
jgi:response regulator RpfG family c-di-GMP phosphodiesterase